jgi:hypothetical protein
MLRSPKYLDVHDELREQSPSEQITTLSALAAFLLVERAGR